MVFAKFICFKKMYITFLKYSTHLLCTRYSFNLSYESPIKDVSIIDNKT